MNSANSSTGLDWLIKLRWCALGGQLTVFVAAITLLGLDLAVGPFLFLLIAGIASNFVLIALARRGLHGRRTMGITLCVDTLLLTGLLHSYGGHTNPFSLFYLVHVVLAAFLLGVGWMWSVLAASTIGFGLQFFNFVAVPELMMHHGDNVSSLHLRGMLLAFVMVAALLGYFLARMRAALEKAQRDVAALEKRAFADEKLVALSTLAAGAAHELRTPLATITLAVSEMIREARFGDDYELRSDLALIEKELQRCESIVHGMSGSSGQMEGELPQPVTLADIVRAVKDHCTPAQRARLRILVPNEREVAQVPIKGLTSVLTSLLRNAFEASEGEQPVQLGCHVSAQLISFTVKDVGNGIRSDLQSRVGDPFFTTKEVGKGMGLGVFLARAFAARCGGSLHIESEEGVGTSVALEIPRAVLLREAA